MAWSKTRSSFKWQIQIQWLCENRFWCPMKILSERQSDVITGKWPEEHKPTTKSPNLETIVEDDLEDDSNDDVHLFLLRTWLQDKARLKHPPTELWTSKFIWNRYNTTWYNASFREMYKTVWLCICTTSNYCSAATF